VCEFWTRLWTRVEHQRVHTHGRLRHEPDCIKEVLFCTRMSNTFVLGRFKFVPGRFKVCTTLVLGVVKSSATTTNPHARSLASHTCLYQGTFYSSVSASVTVSVSVSLSHTRKHTHTLGHVPAVHHHHGGHFMLQSAPPTPPRTCKCGFEIWDLSWKGWGLGFRVWGLGLRVWGVRFEG